MTWLRNNPCRIVTEFLLGRVFGNAYVKPATLQNIMSDFGKIGTEEHESVAINIIVTAVNKSNHMPEPKHPSTKYYKKRF